MHIAIGNKDVFPVFHRWYESTIAIKGLDKIWKKKRERSWERERESMCMDQSYPPWGCRPHLKSFISNATIAVGKQKAWDSRSKSREKTPLGVCRENLFISFPTLSLSLSLSLFLSLLLFFSQSLSCSRLKYVHLSYFFSLFLTFAR